MRLLLLSSLFYLLGTLSDSVLAAVLAIDYGTDFMKASLMNPGVPFDVLLNKDSKRKIQSSVAWKQNDRLFGQDAFNLAARFPKDSFSSTKLLQGAPFSSEAVTFFTTISTADIVETSRGMVALRRPDGTEWTSEELIGMQLSYVKHLAESVAGDKVQDVIITVPPYYTQFERDAVADAVEIAGLRLLTLINDGTAVAVNYAMTRTFSTEPEYHIIYDAGASSIRATVVAFTTLQEKKKAEPGTLISVAGVGYDRNIGGVVLDRRLRDILVEHFNAKHKKDIRSDKRGMAKLWKETIRLKAILSANTEAMSTVESLAWDIDFKSKVKRSEFEDSCSDLKDRFSLPIMSALKIAGLTMENITSVIFTGGATRTPMIQTAVKAAVGEDKIALNVNTDEAAVLGAALYGASLSGRFKTKNIKVADIGVHDIQTSYLSASSGSSSDPRSIKTVIFPAGSKLGNKKTLTFKRKEDFSLFLEYKQQPESNYPTHILEAQITGINEAIANLTERGAVDPVVKATVSLSESGIVSVKNAFAYGEIKDESIAGKIKGLFGGGSSSSTESVDELFTPEARASSSSSAETESTSVSSSPSPSKSSASAKATPSVDLTTIPLNITFKFPNYGPLDTEEKTASYIKLLRIDQEEQVKVRREETRNAFESYLYRTRDLLDDGNDDTPFKKCSQDRERADITKKLEELFEWLHEEGDEADTMHFLDKRNSLETLEAPIIHRYKEIEEFPKALNQSQMWNWSTRLFLTDAKTNMTREEAEDTPSKWTRKELEELEKVLIDHETWLNTWVEKQKSVKMNEDPVISTTEMKARAKVLETHLQKLARRKVPKKVKKATTTSTQAPVPTEEVVVEEEVVEPTTTSSIPVETSQPVDEPLTGEIHDEL